MKKLVVGLVMALGGLSLQTTMAAMPVFSTAAMRHYSVESLSFGYIIHELYKGQTSEPYVEDDRINAMPHTMLGYDDNGHQIIGAMHPIVTYTNTAGETRYLVVIEKVKVSSVNYELIECHVCAGSADMFIFKRLNNGTYELVSRTTDDVEFSGSWGRVNLDTETLEESIEPLGRRLVGSIFETGYLSTGVLESSWNALHLNEDDYIRYYYVGAASSDNTGYYEESSPKAYAYTSTYKVLPDNSKYYPIKITYSGTKENWDKGGRVEPVNGSEIFRFDESSGNYE